MAVAATVIADAQMAAGSAGIYMRAEGCAAASPHGIQCTQLPAIELFTLLHIIPVCIKHSGYFILWLHQRWLYKVSKGLKTVWGDGFAMCRYTSVVSICAWPRSSFMVRIFTPCSNRWVA